MCKTIKQKVRFSAPPRTIYALLADEKKHRTLTGKKTSIPKRIGAPFSFYGGVFSGINVDLVPGRRIVLAWRHRKFQEGIFSMASISLANTSTGGTEITLIHRGVPKDLIPEISSDWQELYWSKIRHFLSRSKANSKKDQ